MAAPRDRKHIIFPGMPKAQPYLQHGLAIKRKKPPAPPDRAAHGQALRTAFAAAVAEADERRQQAGVQVPGATPGVYVQFESLPGWALKLSTLQALSQGIELLAVTHEQTQGDPPRAIERATVFVPEGKVSHFIKRFEEYAKTTPKVTNEKRHEAMLDPVAGLKLATLRGLWTDAPEGFPPEDQTIWWEVWLRRHDGSEVSRLMEFATLARLDVAARRLQFDDRIVTLVRATPRALAASIYVLNDIAELRRAKATASVFLGMRSDEQGEWVKELVKRTTPASDGAPSVCVLDTGVTQGHPLLQASLAPSDCHTCGSDWGMHDHHSHGTEMAGLALYGDLTTVLEGWESLVLRHRLESVKILPPSDRNAPELYGAITAEACKLVESIAPHRPRCFSMAVTAPEEGDRGQPTSWSSALDALAAGRAFDVATQGLVYVDDGNTPLRRLFVVSAGNVREDALQVQHLDRSDADEVQDPAQAWNALTVGAFTEKTTVEDTTWEGYQPLAPSGELSPWSTTSVVFAQAWPIKPDVVFEGGNVLRNALGKVERCSDLHLLTTHFRPSRSLFSESWATSAATPQAARMAATIMAEYPDLWPETVRALIVHSAEWTAAMKRHFKAAAGKGARAQLVRRYGLGVPRLDRALRSASDALTLIAQANIHPFCDGKMGEMHLFELPWPRGALQALGETPVRLRVTLSYFIEPNPGRRGWKQRYRYASHGLRFDVKGRAETVAEFEKRLNSKALAENEDKPKTGDESAEWYLGSKARNHGSLHADFLMDVSAADLAERGVIGIYPVSGWWKEQPKRDRSANGARYALVVSIEAPGIETDIWTPVAQQVGVPVVVEVDVQA